MGFVIAFFRSSSKEQASHSSADALAVVEDVEFVDELVHAVAALCDGAQVGHETHVVTLLKHSSAQKCCQTVLQEHTISYTQFHIPCAHDEI